MDFDALKNFIRIGYNYNLLVYDCNAEAETLTKRLLYLMKLVARRQHQQRLVKIYIPFDVYPDFTHKELQHGTTVRPKFWSMKAEANELLNGGLASPAVKEYLALPDAAMPRHQNSLVIGVSDDPRYAILGGTNADLQWK